MWEKGVMKGKEKKGMEWVKNDDSNSFKGEKWREGRIESKGGNKVKVQKRKWEKEGNKREGRCKDEEGEGGEKLKGLKT